MSDFKGGIRRLHRVADYSTTHSAVLVQVMYSSLDGIDQVLSSSNWWAAKSTRRRRIAMYSRGPLDQQKSGEVPNVDTLTQAPSSANRHAAQLA